MTHRLVVIVLFGALAIVATASAADTHESRVVLVTLDGVRWQDVFRGADPQLSVEDRFVSWREEIARKFLNVADRPAALTPFLHTVVAKRGVLIGNRDSASCAEVTNPYWFSYPGYNEILTGHADPAVNSNDKRDNPNVTVFEWLNKRAGFKDRVRAYGSWDVFPYIFNRKRSGLPVNAGFEPVQPPRGEFEKTLNTLQADVAARWDAVRFDAFTFHYAMESLRRDKPRLLYIGLGETDDFAHDGAYDQYLLALERADRFLRQLWEFLQADQDYAGRTTLIITTDHGRGDGAQGEWRNHGSGRDANGRLVKTRAEVITGSNQTWIAAIGPAVGPLASAGCAHSDQIAATILVALGEDWRGFSATIGAPLFAVPGAAQSR